MRTEGVNPRYAGIERWPSADAVEAMLEGQLSAVGAVRAIAPLIALASEAATHRLVRGGRLFYCGAGTSARIAVQDGAELGPTFGWPDDRIVYVIAGGVDALSHSAEDAEDDFAAGAERVQEAGFRADDVLIGVAASGATPFTLGALSTARQKRGLTIGVGNNPGSPISSLADHPLIADTGPEPIAGSTRMKAGTAQKVILNLLSTAIMMALGHVYQGQMVSMRVSNRKLHQRAVAMVAGIGDVDAEIAHQALDQSAGHIKTAILVARGLSIEAARHLLQESGGRLPLTLPGQSRAARTRSPEE